MIWREPSPDADPAEAVALRKGLAARLAAEGALRSEEWRDAFERTPRHWFVPRFYRRMSGGRALVDGAQPEQRREWLAGVYSNDALVTQCDADDWRIATSSSTQPGLMASMLEALDVRHGHTVLEVGAGTGYNAALLCARLGSRLVTTIDIDPVLVATARHALRRLGHTPTVAVADGVRGFPPNAPYDRIIATCAVTHIPPAWVAQTCPGGLILANLRGGWSDGLVRVEVGADGSAAGRFLPEPAAFIGMRGGRPPEPHQPDLFSLTSGQGRSRLTAMPDGIRDESFWFLAGFVLPHAVLFGSPGMPSVHDAPRLVDLDDGSWSRIDRTPTGGHRVTQGGRRDLWDLLEAAYTQWLALGRPARERYGLTVTADGRQYAWCPTPRGGHTWDLPAPGTMSSERWR